MTTADTWNFKKEMLPALVKQVPAILKNQDKKTGRFGDGVWMVNDQHPMYPLAAAWSIKDENNPYYHRAEVLEAIMLAGDALIADQDSAGKWVFRKKDGSTWGDIYMPWTYSRWIRAYSLVREGMPADTRARWEKALKLGFEGIIREELTRPMQNIPAHDAMALFLASKVFDRPDWEKIAVEYLHRCADDQHPDGYWTEHAGPVVMYNGVYVDLLGVYYGMSHDKYVLPMLERSAKFHAAMTYPDGRSVETVDERNPYHENITGINIGFCFSPEGRAHIRRQIGRMSPHTENPVGPEVAASFLLYGEEGEVAPEPKSGDMYVSGDKQVMTRRDGPWFMCMTSYNAEVCDRRWIQDRQNFVSIYHDKTGLIVGGGNTKLQPSWSTFTVGDTNLFSHKPGDTNPNFIPPVGIVHVPNDAKLNAERSQLDLGYAGTYCRVIGDVSDPAKAKLIYSVVSPDAKGVEAHVTLIPKLGDDWRTASGKTGKLSADPINLAAGESGAWFEHRGARISIPPQASIKWPVLPHNPYTKDGHAEKHEGRIVITLPFDSSTRSYEITVEAP